jgi:large subunit ribosomal protein L24
MKIRRGDNVLVIAGKEKGKTGRVDRQMPNENRLVVEGVNMITRHIKARPGIRQSGRIQQEAPIHVSNVMLICNKCSKPTRPSITQLEGGNRVRSCPKCKEVIDDISQ